MGIKYYEEKIPTQLESNPRSSHQEADVGPLHYRVAASTPETSRFSFLSLQLFLSIYGITDVTSIALLVFLQNKVFRRMDTNGDGTLTSLQFKRGLRKLGIGDYLSERDVRR